MQTQHQSWGGESSRLGLGIQVSGQVEPAGLGLQSWQWESRQCREPAESSACAVVCGVGQVPRGEAWRRLRVLALRPTALGTLLPATPGCPRGYTMLGSACSLSAFLPRGCHAAC